MITNDRYFIINDWKAPKGSNVVLLIQLKHDRVKGTTDILQCPAIWVEAHGRYDLTGIGHRQGEGALMYGTELAAKLNERGIYNFDLLTGQAPADRVIVKK